MEAPCVIHERNRHVQIGLSASLLTGASFAHAGEAAGQGRGVPLPPDGAFNPGLIRASAGGDRWPAERIRGSQRPLDSVTILACVRAFARHKGRNLWHNGGGLFFFVTIFRCGRN